MNKESSSILENLSKVVPNIKSGRQVYKKGGNQNFKRNNATRKEIIKLNELHEIPRTKDKTQERDIVHHEEFSKTKDIMPDLAPL